MLGLAHDLHADCPLTCNHLWIVKWVDEGEALCLASSLRFRGTLVVGLAMEDHVTAQGPNGTHFHLWGGARHHNHRPTAKPLGTQCDALGMVAGTGRNYTARQLVGA